MVMEIFKEEQISKCIRNHWPDFSETVQIKSGSSWYRKNTSILALAHELLGPNYKEAVLELNASDDRYIERLIQSICALVRFARLFDQEILGRLMAVVAAEKVNRGIKSPVDISMDITRLIQTLNMSTTAFRDAVKLTLEAELASISYQKMFLELTLFERAFEIVGVDWMDSQI
uniref:Replication factor C subunit 4-like n=1 Tax=Nicotiana sylvestris TaxID=4096 RepID=A0A1U7X9W1_NICSY|nr:PREDICTED: replication factor C subunit 4-like [Nicotiana sylvestris]